MDEELAPVGMQRSSSGDISPKTAETPVSSHKGEGGDVSTHLVEWVIISDSEKDDIASMD
jgi:hypothetical protein